MGFVAVVLLIIGLIHFYLWKRLVRDPLRPGWGRRVGTALAVLLALLVPLTLIGVRAGYLPWLSWPGYLWIAVMFYLLVTLAALELPRLAVSLLWVRRGRAGRVGAGAGAARTAGPQTAGVGDPEAALDAGSTPNGGGSRSALDSAPGGGSQSTLDPAPAGASQSAPDSAPGRDNSLTPGSGVLQPANASALDSASGSDNGAPRPTTTTGSAQPAAAAGNDSGALQPADASTHDSAQGSGNGAVLSAARAAGQGSLTSDTGAAGPATLTSDTGAARPATPTSETGAAGPATLTSNAGSSESAADAGGAVRAGSAAAGGQTGSGTNPAGDRDAIGNADEIGASIAATEPDKPEGIDRRLLLARGAAIFAGLTAAGVTGYGVKTATGAPQIDRVRIPLAKLPRAMDGTRLAVVSDIHIGPLTGVDHAQRIVQVINSVNADLVCVVGDLVDGSVAELGEFAAPLAGIESRRGAFFVTGNHEYYSGHEQWIDEVARLGLRPLRNERLEIDGLDLAGVNDLNGEEHGDAPDFARALGDRDRSRPVVLMAHQPVAAKEAAPYGVDLQVSGHTHGGQMVPFNFLVKLQQPVVSGFGRVDGVPVYVTNGAGFWGPPVRFGAPPQVTVIELRVK